MVRTLAVAVGILVIGGTLNAKAQNEQKKQAWCAYFTGGPTNCGFATFEQCIEAIKGKTGLCNQNSQYSPAAGSNPSAGRSYDNAHR